MNTAYISANTSAQSCVNTPYIFGGLTGLSSDVSVNGTLFANALTVRGNETLSGNEFVSGNFGVTGTSQLTGVVTLGAALNSASAISGGALTVTTATLSGALNSASAISGGAFTGTTFTGTTATFSSTGTFGGVVTTTAGILMGGTVASPTTLNAIGARFFSRVTTASGTSLVNQDGEISVTNLSVTSCTLQYRSGATAYTFRADAASIL